jgi:hypothetical protein
MGMPIHFASQLFGENSVSHIQYLGCLFLLSYSYCEASCTNNSQENALPEQEQILKKKD